ncbi:hypothetical protein GYH30_052563, partial [Glycine max]
KVRGASQQCGCLVVVEVVLSRRPEERSVSQISPLSLRYLSPEQSTVILAEVKVRGASQQLNQARDSLANFHQTFLHNPRSPILPLFNCLFAFKFQILLCCSRIFSSAFDLFLFELVVVVSY